MSAVLANSLIFKSIFSNRCSHVPSLLSKWTSVAWPKSLYSTSAKADSAPSGTQNLNDSTKQPVALKYNNVLVPTLAIREVQFGGQPYCELPILHILARHNNTIVYVSDETGTQIFKPMSATHVGYKNKHKVSTVASQSLGQAVAEKAKKYGVKSVRVTLTGIGRGRLETLKGIESIGCLDIVSLTDTSAICFGGIKRRKVRRT